MKHKKAKVVTFRMFNDDWERVMAKSNAERISLSEVIRLMLKSYMKKVVPE